MTIRYAAPGDRISLAAGVTILANKAYDGSNNSSVTASSDYAEVTYGPPRMVTIESNIKF